MRACNSHLLLHYRKNSFGCSPAGTAARIVRLQTLPDLAKIHNHPPACFTVGNYPEQLGTDSLCRKIFLHKLLYNITSRD